MKNYMFLVIFFVFGIFYVNKMFSQDVNFSCDDVGGGGVIWCDDFEDDVAMSEKYFEFGNNNGDMIVLDGVGTDGSRGLRILWQQGEIGAGGFKKSFGRTPSNYIGRNSVYPDSSFDEIYWRMDVRHQEGWQGGGPAKLSRALVMANSEWATGMMAHLWSGGDGGNYLGMDPASGVSENGELVATKYNDFENLRWLGWKSGDIDMFSEESSGKWFCVVGHAKLNTPGESDGVFEFWINDSLQRGRYDLNWHGDYNGDGGNMMINAVFFENYWNDGSPVEQERYFDNIVISGERIECNYSVTKGIEESNININDSYITYNNDNFNITLAYSNKIDESDISLFNLLGKNISVNVNNNIININELPDGIYILCIKDKDKLVYKRMLKY